MSDHSQFDLQFATAPADVSAAQALRYKVFVQELGGSGAGVDHAAGQEVDAFDAHADHLLLRDLSRPPGDQVIGVYRLMNQSQADKAGGFSAAAEYDLSPLLNSGRKLLELGRSCLHPDYRGGVAMHHLWTGLADHVRDTGTDVLFGVASFHGTDTDTIAAPLAHLHHSYLAPANLRPRAIGPDAYPMDQLAPEAIDRKAAVADTPALIKAYLRLGGVVGEGAFVDRVFNTVDVCMVVDVATMPDRQRALYARDRA